MSEETLKPCPFCGGEAVLCEIATGHPRFYMRCEDCHSEAGICATEEEAEMIWNSRPIEDALRKRVQELEAILTSIQTICHRNNYILTPYPSCAESSHVNTICEIRDIVDAEKKGGE